MKIGFVNMLVSGRLNPMTALARRLHPAATKSYFSAFLKILE
jgi:hypothetical protein